MKNTVFPHKFWRPFLECVPQLFFRPQYVWFPVYLKGLLIALWYETLLVNWQNWLFTLFHQSRSVLSPNPIHTMFHIVFSWTKLIGFEMELGWIWNSGVGIGVGVDILEICRSWNWSWSWNLRSWSWSWSWYYGDLPELELELELKPPELELELIFWRLAGVGVGVETSGVGVGVELILWSWPQPWSREATRPMT